MSTSTPPLGMVLESFFNDHLKLQRGLRPNSITSYADAMRLLLQFAAEVARKKITQLTLDDLDSDLVSQFLNFLEESRHNAAQSRNQRLAALRTFSNMSVADSRSGLGKLRRWWLLQGNVRNLRKPSSSSAMRSKALWAHCRRMVDMLYVTELC